MPFALPERFVFACSFMFTINASSPGSVYHRLISIKRGDVIRGYLPNDIYVLSCLHTDALCSSDCSETEHDFYRLNLKVSDAFHVGDEGADPVSVRLGLPRCQPAID
jgi:hypothetical protein